MKSILMPCILVAIALHVSGQRRIKKVEIKEEGARLEISYSSIRNKAELSGITLEATPVPTDELNDLFLNSSLLSGQFNYSYYSKSRETYFLRKRNRIRVKSDFEFLMEGLDQLVQKELITQDESDFLENQILTDFRDSTRSVENEEATFANPYLIGNKYLTVFEIQITNNTDKMLSISDPIFLYNGFRMLTALSNNQLVSELSAMGNMNEARSFSIERYNYNRTLYVPPNSSAAQFVAFLPVDLKDDKLDMFIGDTNLKWQVNKTTNIIDTKYVFYELSYDYETTMGNSLINTMRPYELVRPETLQTIGDKLYIQDNQKQNPHEILGYFMYGNALFYSRQKFIPTEYLDLEKRRTKRLVLKATKLTDVSRKVTN